MFSRLTLAAALFGILTTGSLAAASLHDSHAVAPAPTKVVYLERVVITAKRLPAGQ